MLTKDSTKGIEEQDLLHPIIPISGTAQSDFVAPAVFPNKPLEQPIQKYLPQGNETNNLALLRTFGHNLTVDPITKRAVVSKGDYSVIIVNYDATNDELRTTTQQLLDILILKYKESNYEIPEIYLSYAEYMKWRHLTDKTSAKEQFISDVKILGKTSIPLTEKSIEKINDSNLNAGDIDRGYIQIAGGALFLDDGIVFSLGDKFQKVISSYPLMPYIEQLLTIHSNNNPNSYNLLRKISLQKNMNIGKPNENIIAVNTLLDVCEYIPSYEKVKSGDRAYTRRIITPFERDMDALANSFSWEYCHKSGVPLSEEELRFFSYKTFISCLILITWHDYPKRELKEKKLETDSKKKKNTNTAKKKANNQKGNN